MPVRSGSVTFARLRSEPAGAGADVRRRLLKGLAKHAFEPLDPARSDEDRAAGFVTLDDPAATTFDGEVFHGAHALFAWRVDAINVRAAAVKAELDRWASAHAAEHGRPPAKRERAGKRAELRAALRLRTAPVTRTFDVSWDLEAGQVAIWASSRKVVDEIAAGLEAASGLALHPVSVGATAARAGLPESALGPTAALTGLPGLRAEVGHGEA